MRRLEKGCCPILDDAENFERFGGVHLVTRDLSGGPDVYQSASVTNATIGAECNFKFFEMREQFGTAF